MNHLPAGTVTLLFTDIEGSTRLLQQLGDRYDGVLAECRQAFRAGFQAHGGYEVDTQGDAFLVAFARATDAVLAAVTIQRSLANHPWPGGVLVQVRMGLHTGEPRLASEGYVGLDVHHAARIMGAGHGGQVLLSQTTRDLVEHALPEGVHLRDIGEHRLKDLGRKSRLFQLVIADMPADFPPLRTLDAHPNNLPIQPTPLVGREHDVLAVKDLLYREQVCLVTLTGPGGVGKTRLSLQVAAELSEHFRDGIFFVSLAPLSDPALVVPTIAKTLGIREAAGYSLLDRLKEELRQKQQLLLLDNFEQVVSASVQVADLLTVCPQLKLLVTSRQVLHVHAEHEYAVPPLAMPDLTHLPDPATLAHYPAVALFLQRAQAVKPEFVLTNTNARAVAKICAHLDGLPLAIELATARMKLLPLQALLARLGQRLTLLTSGARDAPVRQQTLRNTIEWSYHLLDPREQRLFRRLAIFVGGCTLTSLEAVCRALNDDAEPILDGVASLIDKSLLLHIEQEGQERQEPRLLMLETIREYGLETLAASGEMESTRKAHADYYVLLAEEAEPELAGAQQVVWLKRLEREHDNLRAAMQWSLEGEEAGKRIEKALQLGGVLERFWVVRGHRSEGRAFLAEVLTRSAGEKTPLRAKALIAAARLAFSQNRYEQGEALAQEGRALFRELGDRRGIALSLDRLGMAAWRRGNFTMARALMEEDLALFREVGDQQRVAWSLFTLALLDSKQGEYFRAETLLGESLALHRTLGNTRGIAASLSQLAWVIFVSRGDKARVSMLLEEARALNREVGDKEGMAVLCTLSAWFALSQGDTAAARSLVEEGLILYREMGHQEGTAESLTMLARVEAYQGNYAAARTLYEESLMIAQDMDDKELIASSLEGLAGVAAVQGEPARAVRLWGAAEALREVIGAPLPPIERVDYERLVAKARVQLGEEAFTSAWAQGRTKTPDHVLSREMEKT
jgi:predicted ATPase/class 3 adenylate cyclase